MCAGLAGSNLRFEPGYHKKSPETAGSNLRFTLAPVRAAAGSHGSGLPIRRFASSPANRFAGLQPRYVWLSHATPSILLSLAGEHLFPGVWGDVFAHLPRCLA